MIVDAHHHLWDTAALHYPLFDEIPALQGRYGIAEYERAARAAGITSSVAVEAASAGADGMDELRWVADESAGSSLVQSIVAWAPVDRPDLDAYLDGLQSVDKRVVGIRRSFEFDPPDFPRRPGVIEGVRRLAARGYSFDLVLFQAALPAVVELARACPDVRFVLDHLGKPNLRGGVDPAWHVAIRDLAALPNVTCKISGLVTEADRLRWTREEIRPYIEEAIERFGWDRVMFGTDWPVCNLAGGMERWLDAVRWCIRDATPQEADAFWRGTASRVYRMTRPL